MLTKRILVIVFLAPLFTLFIVLGGRAFAALIILAMGIAAFEYGRIFRLGTYDPARVLLIVGVVALVIQRYLFGFAGSDLVLAVMVILSMGMFVFRYQHGEESSAVDFGITLAGILYLGWLGGYFISLRYMPDGMWWLLVVLPAVWFADGGAFLIGRRFGRHLLCSRVSPKKTWEGYFGGILTAAILTPLLALLLHQGAASVTPLRGLILGLTLAVITPLGDLGESMLKRQFGVKDSGRLLPGHGGIMDRIDSWLWACAIGYYLILWFW